MFNVKGLCIVGGEDECLIRAVVAIWARLNVLPPGVRHMSGAFPGQ